MRTTAYLSSRPRYGLLDLAALLFRELWVMVAVFLAICILGLILILTTISKTYTARAGIVATVGQGQGDFASQVVLEGAKERSRTVLACTFTWTEQPPQALLRLPLYSDSARTHLITEVLFAGQVGDNSVMRGVALVAHLTH